MADIFISYANEDRYTAESLSNAFESEGWSTWWDRDLLTGDNWERVIEAELSSCGCVVVIWSSKSVISDWVRAEAAEGLRRQRLVPVSIYNQTPPVIHRRIQTTDLAVDWAKEIKIDESFRRVVDATKRVIEASRHDAALAKLPDLSPFLVGCWQVSGRNFEYDIVLGEGGRLSGGGYVGGVCVLPQNLGRFEVTGISSWSFDSKTQSLSLSYVPNPGSSFVFLTFRVVTVEDDKTLTVDQNGDESIWKRPPL